jgi:hypothetical protein
MVIFAGVLACVVAAEVFLPVYYGLSFTSVNEVFLILSFLTSLQTMTVLLDERTVSQFGERPETDQNMQTTNTCVNLMR